MPVNSRILFAFTLAGLLAGTGLYAEDLTPLIVHRIQDELLVEQNDQLKTILRRMAIEKDANCTIDWNANPPACKSDSPVKK